MYFIHLTIIKLKYLKELSYKLIYLLLYINVNIKCNKICKEILEFT
jgi:hypothetical protein